MRTSASAGGAPTTGSTESTTTEGVSSEPADGSTAEWKFTQVFHIKDGKVTEVWGMAENDADVDPFLDALPG